MHRDSNLRSNKRIYGLGKPSIIQIDEELHPVTTFQRLSEKKRILQEARRTYLKEEEMNDKELFNQIIESRQQPLKQLLKEAEVNLNKVRKSVLATKEEQDHQSITNIEPLLPEGLLQKAHESRRQVQLSIQPKMSFALRLNENPDNGNQNSFSKQNSLNNRWYLQNRLSGSQSMNQLALSREQQSLSKLSDTFDQSKISQMVTNESQLSEQPPKKSEFIGSAAQKLSEISATPIGMVGMDSQDEQYPNAVSLKDKKAKEEKSLTRLRQQLTFRYSVRAELANQEGTKLYNQTSMLHSQNLMKKIKKHKRTSSNQSGELEEGKSQSFSQSKSQSQCQEELKEQQNSSQSMSESQQQSVLPSLSHSRQESNNTLSKPEDQSKDTLSKEDIKSPINRNLRKSQLRLKNQIPFDDKHPSRFSHTPSLLNLQEISPKLKNKNFSSATTLHNPSTTSIPLIRRQLEARQKHVEDALKQDHKSLFDAVMKVKESNQLDDKYKDIKVFQKNSAYYLPFMHSLSYFDVATGQHMKLYGRSNGKIKKGKDIESQGDSEYESSSLISPHLLQI